jgi:hypothetical protein
VRTASEFRCPRQMVATRAATRPAVSAKISQTSCVAKAATANSNPGAPIFSWSDARPTVSCSAAKKVAEGAASPERLKRWERPEPRASRCRRRSHAPVNRPVCEQNSSLIATTRSSVVGNQCKVTAISPGQIRHLEPSSSSTMSLLSCFLISMTFPDAFWGRSVKRLPNRMSSFPMRSFLEHRLHRPPQLADSIGPYPLMALSGQSDRSRECPLLGVKRTLQLEATTSGSGI